MSTTGMFPTVFLSAVNPHSEKVSLDAMVEVGLHEVIRKAPSLDTKGEQKAESTGTPPESVRFQGNRVGYFCLGRDSSPGAMV
ncbi:hypothetical protein BJX99DRAFT_225571 [Aspergillus californicus]